MRSLALRTAAVVVALLVAGVIMLTRMGGLSTRSQPTAAERAVATIARYAAMVNEHTENIGARRLHTILEKVLEEISFEAPEMKKKTVKLDAAYVQKQLANIVKDQDLSRYIL